MGTPGSKRSYPKGSKQQLTVAFKARVRARLSEIGKDHRWLEAQIGAGRGMVTKMLADEQQTSRLVDEVCRVLSIAPPVIVSDDADEQELVTRFREMDADGRHHLMGIVERLGQVRNKN